MALLRVGFAESTADGRAEEADFVYSPPKSCNCDLAPYKHTHDSYYFDWIMEIENEYYTFEQED